MRLRAALVTAVLALSVAAPAAAQDGEVTVKQETIESFDGTPIFTTLFLPPGATADDPVPVVFRSHGWGGSGEREVSEGSTLEVLLDAGYAVLTWDERGFGDSGDVAHVDSPDFERKDVQVLVDHVAALPEILLDGPGDPRMGFTGGSYAGGIQTVTAAFDDRVDAIAPEISWVDLNYSLFPGGVPKFSWGQLLFGVGLATSTADGLDSGQTGNYEPDLFQVYARGTSMNTNDEFVQDYFHHRSLVGYGEENPIDVPTLVLQGSVDTLFNINEGLAIYEHVRANGAPAKYIIFCGGHVSCPGSYEDAGDRDHLDEAILAWFAKHLRGEDVDTGAPIEYRTNEGEWRNLAALPAPDGTELPVSGEASLISTPVPQNGDLLTSQPSEDGDPHAATFEVAAAERRPLELVGIPTAELSVTGSGPAVHLFLKLVDREAGEVLNLQEAAVRVTDLSSEPQEIELDLAGIAYTLPEGHHLDLQISTTSFASTNARTPAQVDVALEAAIPVRRAGGGLAGGPPTTRADEAELQAVATAPTGALPTTGASLPAALGLLTLALAGALRRRR
ncbi:MAG: CocE/NonD family hydrolase [Nitriliruptorales bacterium]